MVAPPDQLGDDGTAEPARGAGDKDSRGGEDGGLRRRRRSHFCFFLLFYLGVGVRGPIVKSWVSVSSSSSSPSVVFPFVLRTDGFGSFKVDASRKVRAWSARFQEELKRAHNEQLMDRKKEQVNNGEKDQTHFASKGTQPPIERKPLFLLSACFCCLLFPSHDERDDWSSLYHRSQNDGGDRKDPQRGRSGGSSFERGLTARRSRRQCPSFLAPRAPLPAGLGRRKAPRGHCDLL